MKLRVLMRMIMILDLQDGLDKIQALTMLHLLQEIEFMEILGQLRIALQTTGKCKVLLTLPATKIACK
jgi:hypothetical protein